jgi:hypothetical protein
MPYIAKEDRKKVANVLHVETHSIDNAGEMQYAIALMIKSYVARKGLSYQACNDVMGALAGAQMEFYRKTVAPYEDKKIQMNGDV